jgi:hypothetical protein
MTWRATTAGLLALCALVPGCSSDEERGEPARADEARAEPAGPERPHPARRSSAPLRRASCPPDLANCSSAAGRILYVERVDPDGDGDAHFVLLSREGITAPGISVIDVKRALRPRPLPVPGDRLSASGPVYRGSHGQRQIEAIELHVAR